MQIFSKPLQPCLYISANGDWSDVAPVCEINECPEPDELIDGYTDYKDLSKFAIVRLV